MRSPGRTRWAGIKTGVYVISYYDPSNAILHEVLIARRTDLIMVVGSAIAVPDQFRTL
jgi:hypothetical protein